MTVAPIPSIAIQPALSKNVTDALRQMITSGRFAPGHHLKEGEIAEALGVSRGPVREAFALLANEGYIEQRRHRGAFVTTLRRRDIHEVYTLRLALERLAVQRAAARMTPELLQRMDDVLGQMRAVDGNYGAEQVVELDLAFHDVIYAAADHVRLMKSWQFIRSQVAFFLLARNVSHRDFLEVGYPEHKSLRDVLATGDVTAAEATILSHLNGAYSRLLEDHAGEVSPDDDADNLATLEHLRD
jgi:DNA-binding GntR family transcriptional regulator